MRLSTYQAAETIEAAVASGDEFTERKARAELAEYIRRWQRCLEALNEDLCARCDSILDEKGLCADETCPFSDVQQDDPKGWVGHPNPPEEPNVACPKCGAVNEFSATRVEEYLQYVSCNECGAEITNEEGQEGTVSQEDWDTVVFKICWNPHK